MCHIDSLVARIETEEMSRPLAILFALFLLGMAVVASATEHNPLAGAVDQQTRLLNVASQIVLAIGLLLYCGFAALHSTQHVASPQERSMWLVLTVLFNVLGSCWYVLTEPYS